MFVVCCMACIGTASAPAGLVGEATPAGLVGEATGGGLVGEATLGWATPSFAAMHS